MAPSLTSGQPALGLPHRLRLPAGDGAAATAVAAILADAALRQSLPPPGPLRLEAGTGSLKAAELQQLAALLAEANLELVSVVSADPGTRVAAAALGLAWEGPIHADPAAAPLSSTTPPSPQPLTVHQGTLRSGDHLEAEGSLLVLGDVNPGARVSAGGHVLVWGQLRGVAHAGCGGNESARIVALQLRPVQLRIAARVARGPAEPPPSGLAEQAVIEDGVITIQPAQPSWPVSASRA